LIKRGMYECNIRKFLTTLSPIEEK
jgi:hypothetical protein